MRLRKIIAGGLLFLLSAVLAGGNWWFAAARSTIPLALDDQVLGKELRREKHAGKDDVCLLQLSESGEMQVDRAVYDSVAVGETLRKEPWSRELTHGDQVLQLDWSQDYRGMIWTIPLCLAVLAGAIAFVLTGRGLSPENAAA